MNKLKTAMIVSAGIATIGGVGLGTAATTSATGGGIDGRTSSSWGWYWGDKRDDRFDASLATSLSTKFNIDKAQLETAIEEVRDDQFNVLNDKRVAALQKAVADQTITQEQHDQIVTRLTTIDELYDQLDDTEGEERRAIWKEIKNDFRELREWVRNEKIPLKLLGFSESHHDRLYGR